MQVGVTTWCCPLLHDAHGMQKALLRMIDRKCA